MLLARDPDISAASPVTVGSVRLYVPTVFATPDKGLNAFALHRVLQRFELVVLRIVAG